MESGAGLGRITSALRCYVLVLIALRRWLVGEVRRGDGAGAGRVRVGWVRLVRKVRGWSGSRAVGVCEFMIACIHVLSQNGDVGGRGYVLRTRALWRQ